MRHFTLPQDGGLIEDGTSVNAFEKIQTAFFEHLFTIIHDFDLKIYQLSPLDRSELATQI